MKDRKRKPDSRKNIVFNIQSIILSVLMAISLVTIIVMGLLLYHRFKLALEKTAVDNTEATVEATVDRLNADLLDIRQIINGANYNVVQQFDISSREFSEQFSLLYETNSDKIQSLALYDPKGNLIASEPVAAEKKNVKVQTQEWYKNAEDAIENIHFSTPHIQELFEDGSYRYQWVVSLSRYVDAAFRPRPPLCRLFFQQPALFSVTKGQKNNLCITSTLHCATIFAMVRDKHCRAPNHGNIMRIVINQ